MAAPHKKLNGNVDRLAEALRNVVREAAADAVEPLRQEVRVGFERTD